jgi:2,3,4,5-tetrahydropyridine-2-carboxylate N-succinyltransferase
MLYLRNSLSGTVEARSRTGAGISLNSALHANH